MDNAILRFVLAGLRMRLSATPGFSDRHTLALVWGALRFFMFIVAPVREWATNPADNPAGMLIVALVFFPFLAWMWRRTRSPATT